MGSIIVAFILVVALLGPVFAPQDPYDVGSLSLTDSYKPPAWQEGGDSHFVLGTDSQGRDMLSLLIYGSRVSLFIGVQANHPHACFARVLSSRDDHHIHPIAPAANDRSPQVALQIQIPAHGQRGAVRIAIRSQDVLDGLDQIAFDRPADGLDIAVLQVGQKAIGR